MRIARATAFVLLVLPAAGKGQSVDALSLQSGARARILGRTAGSKYELITVASASPDSLRYSLDPSLAIKPRAWQQISKMDASIGRHTNVGRGAGIGFLVGLIGGAALAAHQSWGTTTRDYNELRALGIVTAGLTMGALGGLVGAVIGHAQRTEDGVPVTLSRTPVASNRISALGRRGVPVAQSGSCVSDTTEDAKQYRYGYGGMVSRTDSQSVVGRTILGLT